MEKYINHSLLSWDRSSIRSVFLSLYHTENNLLDKKIYFFYNKNMGNRVFVIIKGMNEK